MKSSVEVIEGGVEIRKVETSKIRSSIPVVNDTEILSRIITIQVGAYNKGLKSLSQSLVTELMMLFGASNKIMKLEYRTRVWVLEHCGIYYNVFTAVGRGTSIEICDYTFEDVRLGVMRDQILDFLEELRMLVNTVEMV
jgi:hypothetical protein